MFPVIFSLLNYASSTSSTPMRLTRLHLACVDHCSPKLRALFGRLTHLICESYLLTFKCYYHYRYYYYYHYWYHYHLLLLFSWHLICESYLRTFKCYYYYRYYYCYWYYYHYCCYFHHQLSAAGLFKYVWPFSGHQALKG